MIARLIDTWRERTDWSKRFWMFAVKFYANPWFAWSWLSARKDGSPVPAWQRVSSTVIGLVQILIAGVIIWLLILSFKGPFLVTLLILNLLFVKLLSIALRAQGIFIACGGERSART